VAALGRGPSGHAPKNKNKNKKTSEFNIIYTFIVKVYNIILY
jgi:hypothetical protein